jgi:hypothetical protein
MRVRPSGTIIPVLVLNADAFARFDILVTHFWLHFAQLESRANVLDLQALAHVLTFDALRMKFSLTHIDKTSVSRSQ